MRTSRSAPALSCCSSSPSSAFSSSGHGGPIQANGRIEGDHVTVASKFAARVARLAVREGDSVERGQPLVILSDAQVDARITQAEAALAQSEERIHAAAASLHEAQAGVAQAHTTGSPRPGREPRRRGVLGAPGGARA